MNYRFRTEGDLLVLQVMDQPKRSPYVYGDEVGTWRDARVQDIPVNDPFSRVEYVSVQPPGPSFD